MTPARDPKQQGIRLYLGLGHLGKASWRGIWERHLGEAKSLVLQYGILSVDITPPAPPIISPCVNIFGNQCHIIFTIKYYIPNRKKYINACQELQEHSKTSNITNTTSSILSSNRFQGWGGIWGFRGPGPPRGAQVRNNNLSPISEKSRSSPFTAPAQNFEVDRFAPNAFEEENLFRTIGFYTPSATRSKKTEKRPNHNWDPRRHIYRKGYQILTSRWYRKTFFWLFQVRPTRFAMFRHVQMRWADPKSCKK